MANLFPQDFTGRNVALSGGVSSPVHFGAEVITTDATAGVELIPYDLTNFVVLDGETWVFDVLLVARQTGGAGGVVGNSAGYVLRGVIKRIGASTTRVGAQDKTVLAEDDAVWDVEAAANDTTESLAIKVTGAVNQTILWRAQVRLVKVS